MSVKISLKRINKAVLFEARNDDGNTIIMDGTEDLGGEGKGVRPMQALLMSAAGCSAIDIVMILGKMKQPLDDVRIDVTGDIRKYPSHKEYEHIRLDFYLEGDIKHSKAYKAAELSVEKYCSVLKILSYSAEVSFQVYLNDELIEK